MSVAALTSYKTGKPDTTEREGCLHVNSASDAKSIVDGQQFYKYWKTDQQQNRVHETAL